MRFLDYTSSQQERQKRRAVRSEQTLSWQDINSDYSSNGDQVLPESTAVVCDINKEMLKVGKDKAEKQGYSSGEDSWLISLVSQTYKDYFYFVFYLVFLFG